MPYNFRLRFDLLPGDHINCSENEMELFESPGGQIVRLRSGSRGTPIQDHSRASLVGGPYDSEDDARAAAEHIRQALLIWAVKNRFGLDVGDGKTRTVLTDAGKVHFEKQLGKPVRSDLLGIDVYPDEGDVVFIYSKLELKVGRDAKTFATEIRHISKQAWSLSDKQKVAGELYSASFFDQVSRSRFITLVTAVEALLTAQRRDPVVQTFLDQARASAQGLNIESATEQALTSGLERLRHDSIGQAGRRMSDELLAGRSYGGMSPGDFFNTCYSIRSQTVHRGAPEDKDVDFLDLANKSQEFVGDLLMASFEASAASAARPGLAGDGRIFPI